jgi:hypothetical protein
LKGHTQRDRQPGKSQRHALAPGSDSAGAIAIIEGEVSIAWTGYNNLANRVANGLREFGNVDGDRGADGTGLFDFLFRRTNEMQ